MSSYADRIFQMPNALLLEGNEIDARILSVDPKSNSAFKPIARNVPGIQISDLLPQVAK
jgi:hypothetical protein